MIKQITRNILISNYYNAVYKDYNEYYSNDHIHYGFWFNNTRTHEESLDNTIEEVIKYLKIEENDIILDAGCGSGGSCRFISNRFNVYIIGITLSEVLLQAAILKSSGISNSKCVCLLNDYHTTSFKDNTFNKIYGIESICYSENVEKFCNESYRILKEDGKLVIADFFKNRYDLNDGETKIYLDWLNGWAMPDINSVDKYVSNLSVSGYRSIKYYDATFLIKKSIETIYNTSNKRLMKILLNSGTFENEEFITNHLISGCRQKDLFDKNIIQYGIITAIK